MSNFNDFLAIQAAKLNMTREEYTSYYLSEAKPGPKPYHRGLDDNEIEDKKDQIKKQSDMDDDDSDAYKEMPGDKEARKKGEVKTSKHVKKYHELYGDKKDESVDEATFRPNSGTMSGGTYNLDNRKYELKKDVEGVQIGNYTNIVLPKGTIIYNIPGGVFADHSSLKRYENRSNKYFNKSTFKGISIIRKKETIFSIDKNSKILESVVNEDFPGKGETVKAKDLNHEMLDYFNRMNISLSINTKSKKNIKGSVGTMFNDLVFNGGDIDKKDIVSVKIIESVVNEEKIKYAKGKTYQSSGHWTVMVDSNSSMCDIRVNHSAGWRLDPHDDREETWELLDNGRQRATINFRRGNIDKFAQQMFDLNDRTTWGNKTKLTAKDYADIIRVWIDMRKANESLVTERKTISSSKISMMGAKILRKLSIGTIFDTEDGEYEITDYGQQANAFKEFEAEHNGKKVKVKLTAMYGVKLEVTDDVRSARFNKEVRLNSIILESAVTEGLSKSAIKKAIKVIDKQIDTETGGDGEALDNETLQALEQERERLLAMNESKFSPLGYAKRVISGEITLKHAMEEAGISLSNISKLIKKLDKTFDIDKAFMAESVILEKAEGDRGPISDPKIEKALKTKSEETGVPIGIIRIIMRRGMAAWKTGHRPGATEQQWGYARVNAFLTKGKGTWGDADKDVAKEVRDEGHDGGLKEHFDQSHRTR